MKRKIWPLAWRLIWYLTLSVSWHDVSMLHDLKAPIITAHHLGYVYFNINKNVQKVFLFTWTTLFLLYYDILIMKEISPKIYMHLKYYYVLCKCTEMYWITKLKLMERFYLEQGKFIKTTWTNDVCSYSVTNSVKVVKAYSVNTV